MASLPPLGRSSAYTSSSTPFTSFPKNGHLSTSDPAYASSQTKATLDTALASIWQHETWPTFRRAWDTLLPPTPVRLTWPREGREVLTSFQHVPVRDGHLVETKTYRRPDVKPDAAMMFRMHGGGWATGGHGMEEAENLYLAFRHDVVVIGVAYRLAPEWPFPTGVRDCFDVLRWCISNAHTTLAIDPNRIVTIGGSAGGNLSAVMALMARDASISGIVGQILNFPITCHPRYFASLSETRGYELASYVQNKDDTWLSAMQMEFFWDCYGTEEGEDWEGGKYHSPLLRQDLDGLPPALIQVGGLDVLRDEGIAYGEALKAAGNEVEVYAYRGLPHVFNVFCDFPQREEYYKRQDEFIERLLRGR
ncbi:alpha/beta hydrolase fold-domain-containing protein [Coniochaeta sp. 2T2.1]|nr:alpha/beta hydrolase fold-domain-containing protein [Coniochaeta sp. 2T2.1]